MGSRLVNVLVDQVSAVFFNVLIEEQIDVSDIVAEYFGSEKRPNGYSDNRWKERRVES